MTETLLLAAILIPCLIIAIVFHEVAHGWAALALGDTTARDMGRLTLNPIRHVDPIGTLLVPGALALFGGPIFGWAKPVPVNQRRLDNPRFGMMAVAAAGPGTNLLLGLVGAVLLGMFGPNDPQFVVEGGTVPLLADGAGNISAIGSGLFYFIVINAFLAFFNLLPIPPFDGSHIVGGLMPRKWARHWQRVQSLGMLLIVVLIAATWIFPDNSLIASTVLPPVEWIVEWFLSLADRVSGALAS